MARPKNKEEDILSAAIKVFEEKGFSNSSMQVIADNAGVGKGTIYEYFKSKKELHLQTIKYCGQKYGLELERRISRKDTFLDKLNEYIDFNQKVIENNFKGIELLMMASFSDLKLEEKEELKNTMMGMREEVAKMLSEIFHEGVAEGIIVKELDEELAGDIFTDMIAAYCRRFAFAKYSDEQKDMEREKLVNFIMNGIGRR